MTGDAGVRFGELLRRFRLAAGLSQQALGERSGLSVDAIAALERGRRRRPRAFTLRVLADSLQLDEPRRVALVDAAGGQPGDGVVQVARPPAPFGPLVGREVHLHAISSLLGSGDARLVTLTGPGGVGKTQLALAVAAELAGAFTAGACWVPLASISDPAMVPGAVTAALGEREVTGRALADLLLGRLAGRDLLLLFDNCEHVITDCAALIERLLSCAGVRVLATSRERLRLPGEVVRPVPPLQVPATDDPTDRLAGSDAVHLFVQRARSLVPEFEVGERDAPVVAEICRELDGIPLALELAAARANVLTVQQIATGLGDSLALPASRTSAPRQQTLPATMGWSYDLLLPDEQRMLRRLSVFAGGWTLPAAAAVGLDAGSGPAALALVSSLVDKSLVSTREHGGEVRYLLLYTIRRYAYGKLHASGEHTAAEAAHTAYFLQLAERAEPGLYGPDQVTWLDRLDAEIDNLRAALDWAAAQDAATGLRLAGALWRFCYLRGRYTEGRAWLAGALARGEHAESLARAKALLGAGALAFLQCEYGIASSRIEAALDLYEQVPDHRGVADALQRLGSIARETGRYEDAVRLHEQSLTLWKELGEETRVAESLNYLGFLAWLTGDFRRAGRLCTEALRAFRRLGDGEGTVWALISLGAAARCRGLHDAAATLLWESMNRSHDTGFLEGIAWSLDQLGNAARCQGRIEQAWGMLAESLERHQHLGDSWRIASVYEGLAETIVETRPALAARLVGAADRVRSDTGARRPSVEAADRNTALARCRTALGVDAYADAREAGYLASPADLLTEVQQLGEPLLTSPART
ncbi:MAG: ATP-binding protein [Streptosporangiales bacterium]